MQRTDPFCSQGRMEVGGMTGQDVRMFGKTLRDRIRQRNSVILEGRGTEGGEWRMGKRKREG